MTDRTLIAVVDEDASWLAAMGGTLMTTGYHALLIGDESAVDQIVSAEPVVAIVSSVPIARALREAMGDTCPVLLLVTSDIDELSEEDEMLFQAAYEKPASIDRVLVEVRRVVRGRRTSGTVLRSEIVLVTTKAN